MSLFWLAYVAGFVLTMVLFRWTNPNEEPIMGFLLCAAWPAIWVFGGVVMLVNGLVWVIDTIIKHAR